MIFWIFKMCKELSALCAENPHYLGYPNVRKNNAFIFQGQGFRKKCVNDELISAPNIRGQGIQPPIVNGSGGTPYNSVNVNLIKIGLLLLKNLNSRVIDKPMPTHIYACNHHNYEIFFFTKNKFLKQAYSECCQCVDADYTRIYYYLQSDAVLLPTY